MSDVFSDRERGTAMAVYTMGPLLGPVLGPSIGAYSQHTTYFNLTHSTLGGFVVQTIGVRWIFILLTIMGGGASLLAIPLLEETYTPVIKERIRKRLAKERSAGGDVEGAGAGADMGAKEEPRMSLAEALRVNLSRPLILLTRSLICFMLSLYMALYVFFALHVTQLNAYHDRIYGFLYLMFTTFPTLFSEIYGWGPGVSGLAYLGPGVGFFIAAMAGGRLMSKVYEVVSRSPYFSNRS